MGAELRGRSRMGGRERKLSALLKYSKQRVAHALRCEDRVRVPAEPLSGVWLWFVPRTRINLNGVWLRLCPAHTCIVFSYGISIEIPENFQF